MPVLAVTPVLAKVSAAKTTEDVKLVQLTEQQNHYPAVAKALRYFQHACLCPVVEKSIDEEEIAIDM